MERITLHQLRRRDLWTDVVKNSDIATADKVLAAFDAKFSEPGSSNLEVEVTFEGDISKVDRPSLSPVYELDLSIKGQPGSGKTTLLNWLRSNLPDAIQIDGMEPVKVLRIDGSSSRSRIEQFAQKYGRVLLIRDDQE